jgi:uncharacterized membrane protein YiaA
MTIEQAFIALALALVFGGVLGFLIGAWRASCTTGKSMRAVILGGGPRPTNPV